MLRYSGSGNVNAGPKRQVFLAEWQSYVRLLSGQGEASSGDISDALFSGMNLEQRQRLAALREEVQAPFKAEPL